MKKILISAVCCAVLGVTFAFIGVSSVSAYPANVRKDTGCLVKDALEMTYFDPNCTFHRVRKFDNDGYFQFYYYEDHGQLPEGAVKPPRPMYFNDELCGFFFPNPDGGFEYTCGPISESITPSGQYRSTLRFFGSN